MWDTNEDMCDPRHVEGARTSWPHGGWMRRTQAVSPVVTSHVTLEKGRA